MFDGYIQDPLTVQQVNELESFKCGLNRFLECSFLDAETEALLNNTLADVQARLNILYLKEQKDICEWVRSTLKALK